MKKPSLLLEDFHSIIPEFMLNDAVHRCCDAWRPGAKKLTYDMLADKLLEELRALMKRYIFMNPTWQTPTQKARVAAAAVIVLDDSKKKVVEILTMPGRERDEIKQFLNQLVLQQVDAFLRNTAAVTRP